MEDRTSISDGRSPSRAVIGDVIKGRAERCDIDFNERSSYRHKFAFQF